ncbi:receptor like protein 29-like [Magnolia sinica]|uniref:receptor like protein 29-like n=1 Tax=Magnolia sinica TaxID=86752 RepID=UPI002657B863|nr:receptor like protein 29-like [Magnolia sinica]
MTSLSLSLSLSHTRTRIQAQRPNVSSLKKEKIKIKIPMFPPSLTFLLSAILLLLPSSLSTHAKHHTQNVKSMNMNMDPLELDTLFHIMESMSSDRKWRLSNPSPCNPGSSWPGIECKPGNDNLLHVSRLDFGTPPNPSCKKTATFPTQIFNLPYLQSIFFFNCFILTKTSLSIPPQTTHRPITSLQQLSLRSNHALVGPIPPQISTLKSLQILTLSQNRLHGEIPVEISSLTSLIHLDLSYNFLTGSIPNQIGNLRSLVGLDLSYNSLIGPIPAGIGQLVLLQKLDLSSNSLTGGIPDSLESLSLLVFIALNNNRLMGKFPKGLGKLQSLQYFIMDENPMFTPLPAGFGRLVKLQELRLANSGYSGVIPSSFSQLLNLTTLSLQNNRLTGEIPVGLRNLSHIYHLNLSRNLLVGVVPFDVGFLKRLGMNVDLSGNPGLCLNGSEGFEGAKMGISSICGNSNKTGFFVHPLKRSSARSGVCSLGNLVGVLGVWGLYQRLY